jgi:hypothetical protein
MQLSALAAEEALAAVHEVSPSASDLPSELSLFALFSFLFRALFSPLSSSRGILMQLLAND